MKRFSVLALACILSLPALAGAATTPEMARTYAATLLPTDPAVAARVVTAETAGETSVEALRQPSPRT